MDKVKLDMMGTLTLDVSNASLADLEAFAAEARRLGLEDNAKLRPFRMGAFGPIVNWHFDVPVQPKVKET